MITLITGLPGTGKTLYTLWFVKRLAEADLRPVFYAGINELTLPWTKIDPQKWTELPDSAILVIDEAQDVFEPMANGAKRPDFYKALAKHRHGGLDIFVITQGPKLIDIFLRELVGRHFHVVRRFGFDRAKIYEWPLTNILPQSASAQKLAILHKFRYPKEVYGYYKSASDHTVKAAIPGKIISVVCFIVLALSVVAYTFNRMVSKAVAPASAVSSVEPAVKAVGSMQGASGVDPISDAQKFVHASTPRVSGLPHTAPKYDELTRPVRVPVPAACIAVGSMKSEKGLRCKCYSQQGTPMQVEYHMCLEIADKGFFQDFEPEPNRQQSQPGEVGPRDVQQVAALDARQASSNVIVIPYVPDQPKLPARK